VWPRANVGVILGLASGLVGVDVDGEGGLDVLKQISCGELPRTATFTTGKGLRLLYRLPAGVFVPSAVYPGGLEILAEGRQTVMPPSVHVCSAAYRWARGKGPAALSNAPDWLWRSRGRGQVLPGAGGMAGEGPILEGNPGRNSTLFRVAAAMARAGAAAGDIRAAMREMNRRCQPALGEAELNSIVRSACRYRPCQERP
jgi:hypothetical protein